MANNFQVRIIAGKWRGRKINFPDQTDLRPSGDRSRETLFNWLTSQIQGANCLDCFAGSGALGFEALSRGAQKVILCDHNPEVIKALKQSQTKLDAKQADILPAQFPEDFQQFKAEKFDLIFLDPPFQKNLLLPCLDAIFKYQLLTENGLVYFEVAKDFDLSQIKNFEIHRQKRAGNVMFGLLCAKPDLSLKLSGLI